MKQLRLSDQELEALAADTESDRVERTERLTGEVPNKIREAICAFANDLTGHGNPGVILVGLDDAGKHIGLAIGDELLLRLADMRSDGNIVPIPSLSVENAVCLAATSLSSPFSRPTRHLCASKAASTSAWRRVAIWRAGRMSAS